VYERLRLGFEIVPWLTRTVVRIWFGRIVPDVKNGPVRGSPGSEQSCDVLFGIRIVPLAPARVINRFLNVDDDQCGLPR